MCFDKYIDYDCFLKLYEPFSIYVTKSQFAEIIGIKHTDFEASLKYRPVKMDSILKQRIRVQHLTKDSRIYDLTEINDICKKNNISLDLFLSIVTNSTNNDLIQEYKEVLFQKKKIYIGDRSIDTIYIEKYGQELIEYTNKVSMLYSKQYRANEYIDDVASDTIFHIIENTGAFFENFSEEIAIKKIKQYIRKAIEYRYKKYFKMRRKLIKDEEKNSGSKDRRKENLARDESRNRKMIDRNANTENMAIKRVLENSEMDGLFEKCIKLLEYYYEQGFSNTEAINKVAEDLNLEKEKMLNFLKEALILKNKIKQTSKGEYYLE